MPIKHAFTSAKSDGGDTSLVRPSNWNADHTGVANQQLLLPILMVTTKVEVTWATDSTTYVDLWYLEHLVDFDIVPYTHYRVYGFGRANAAGATIFFRAVQNGTTSLGSDSDATSVGSTNATIDSGWKSITPALTGANRLGVLIRGSTATVDFTYQKLGLLLKYDG